jgi:hypothetical protein
MRKTCYVPAAPDETIGQFGNVRLVLKFGRHELTGGNERERGFVRLWCARYAPFITFGEPPVEPLVLAA